jgi:glycosyltransferase involved in cell wall biosynthesis
LELISNLNLNGRVIQEDANDLELNDLYSQAELYVMPSLYEGFGLPALEAMAAKCPVLLSDTSSLPEVGGQAAHYFPAGDKRELAMEMRKIVTSPDMRHSMVMAGLVQATNFSWKKCAEETATGYRLAVQAKG